MRSDASGEKTIGKCSERNNEKQETITRICTFRYARQHSVMKLDVHNEPNASSHSRRLTWKQRESYRTTRRLFHHFADSILRGEVPFCDNTDGLAWVRQCQCLASPSKTHLSVSSC